MKKERKLIDTAISRDRNVIKNEAEKILKYKELTIQIQRTWNVKTKVLPVIIKATGTIPKSFKKYLSNILESTALKSYRKTAILGTAYILRIVLVQKYKTFVMGNNITRITYFKHRTLVTLSPQCHGLFQVRNCQYAIR